MSTKVDFNQIKNKRLNGLDDVNAPSPSSGDALLWNAVAQKWVPGAVSGGQALSTSVTYGQLYAMYNNGALVTGMTYLITDYLTTTNQKNTKSGDHPFNLLVFATSEYTLHPIAAAVKPEGKEAQYWDEVGADLSRWLIWYDIENNTEKYAWAVDKGYGVIYRLIDEWGNDCPYDFKNIRFEGGFDHGIYTDEVANGWMYTFDDDGRDASLTTNLDPHASYGCINNSIEPFRDEYGVQKLNRVIFLSHPREGTEPVCEGNRVGYGCEDIVFALSCSHNTVGENCSRLRIGWFSYGNVFGPGCTDISLGYKPHALILDEGWYCNNFFSAGTSRVWLYDGQDGDYSHLVQNLYFAQGYSDGQLHILQVDHRSNNYRTTYSRLPNGNERIYCEDVPDVVVASADITLSKTYQVYIEVNGTQRYIRLPSSDPYSTARTPSSHSHGNITNAGALNNTDVDINDGDKLVVADASNSNKAAKTTVTFDGSTTTEFLSRKGTWETPPSGGGGESSLSGLSDTNIPSPNDGDHLVYDSATGKWVSSAAPSQPGLPDLGIVYAEEVSFDGQTFDALPDPGYGDVSSGSMVSVRFFNSVPEDGILSINGNYYGDIVYKGNAIQDGYIVAGDTALFVYGVNTDYGDECYMLLAVDRWHRDIPFTISNEISVAYNGENVFVTFDTAVDKQDIILHVGGGVIAFKLGSIRCYLGSTVTVTINNTQNTDNCLVDVSPVIVGLGELIDITDGQNPVVVDCVLLQDVAQQVSSNGLEVPAGTAVAMKITIMEPTHIQALIPNCADRYAKIEIVPPIVVM